MVFVICYIITHQSETAMKWRANLVCVAGVMVCFCPACTKAQQAQPDGATTSDDVLHILIDKYNARARNDFSPRTGTSAYVIDDTALAAMPEGTDNSLDRVLEQMPGAAQDSYGQVHLRGEHADLQYRLNGILLPEGISGFGQTLDPRMIGSVTLLDGALPAQYGYRTAGVVDIQTKTGLDNGGTAAMNAGSYGT